MRTGYLLFIVLSIGGLVAGCGSTLPREHLMPEPVIEGELDKDVAALAKELADECFPDTEEREITLLDVFHISGGHTDLEDRITLTLRNVLGSMKAQSGQRFRLVPAEIVKANIAALGLSVSASSISDSADKWNEMGAETVIMGYWKGMPGNVVEVTLEVFDTKHDGKRVCVIGKEIPKTDEIRRLMGEKLPGRMLVMSPDEDAVVECDYKSIGEVGPNGIEFEVPYGSHTIRVNKAGYHSFYKTIDMPERGTEELRVKFVSPTGAPLKAFLMNVLAPGTPTLIYGRSLPKDQDSMVINAATSLGFYIAGAMFMVDHLVDHQFLTKSSEDSYNRRKDAEMYTALGFYGLSLISAPFVGADYLRLNRKGLEMTALEFEDPCWKCSREKQACTVSLLRLSF